MTCLRCRRREQGRARCIVPLQSPATQPGREDPKRRGGGQSGEKVEIGFRWGGSWGGGNAVRGRKMTVRRAFKPFGINALIPGKPDGTLVGTVQVFSSGSVWIFDLLVPRKQKIQTDPLPSVLELCKCSRIWVSRCGAPNETRTAGRGPQIANNGK